ncbi:hypothetical protein FJZ39_00085 [Candidatus Saccharibacteria bacterium]|nr:hypothetical protein [Candidatus Saccharibacteria bacterium]
MQSKNKVNPTVAVIIAIALIASIAVAIALFSNSSERQQTSPTTSTQGAEPQTATYANGTYEATGEYVSPGGRESIDVSVTVMNGKITDTTITPNADSGEAEEYQQRFAASYKDMVVGKSIDEVSLTRVAGSSLTGIGFNDALEQIKEDAAA